MIFQLLRSPLLILEETASGFFANPTLWRIVNFTVFVAFLIYILRNKIRIGKVFDDRAKSILKELDAAKREKAEAEQRLAEVEARLQGLDQEIAQMKIEADREAERESERIRRAAEADGEKIQITAQREIEGALKAARNELRAFVAEQSVQLAEGIIRREIRPEDDARMMNRYVEDLGEVTK